MSQEQDIEFHEGETWQILFAAHRADGTPLALPPGSDLQFRISGDGGPMLTMTVDHGVLITDETLGLASIVIDPQTQLDSGLVADTYLYEARTLTLEMVSIQANGKCRILPSLFAVP
jgi:hypothetical protein